MRCRNLHALFALMAVGMAGPAFAQSYIETIQARLVANPHVYSGCPAQIFFRGAILVQGHISPSEPVEVGYQFLRSDGGAGPARYLTFRASGAMAVQTDWQLHSPYEGWEQLKVWVTRGGPDAYSRRAEFRVMCR
jgi:hypothetical protein